MATEIFVPTAPASKPLVSETTTAPLVAALQTLLAAGGHWHSDAVACQVQALHSAAVLAKPETLSDALACLLALHSEVFDFTGYNSLCANLPAEQQRTLKAFEQRWSRLSATSPACSRKPARRSLRPSVNSSPSLRRAANTSARASDAVPFNVTGIGRPADKRGSTTRFPASHHREPSVEGQPWMHPRAF